MKKSVVALTALLALGLAACQPTQSSTTQPGSTDSSISEENGYKKLTINNKDELTKKWYLGSGDNRILSITTDPASNPVTLLGSGALTITSSNTQAVTVTGLGINAVGVGTSTITATLTNESGTTVSDTVNVTVEAMPEIEPVKTTIADILDGKTNDGNTVYQVEGIIEGRDLKDKYGECFLTDPATGRSLEVYNLCSTMDAFTQAGDGTLKYSGTQDAPDKLSSVANGMKVTLNVQWAAEHGNCYAVYVSSVASTETYSITSNPSEHGTYSLSATGPVAYGTEITLTATPESGYKVETVVLENYKTNYLQPNKDGKYVFTAAVKNVITVTFAQPTGGAVIAKPADKLVAKFGMTNTALNKNVYLNGEVSGYYLATTDDYNSAIDVEVGASGEGWTLLAKGGTNSGKYIGAVASGDHVNAQYVDEAFVWTYDDAHDAFTATVGEKTVFMGNYGNYTNIGCSETEHLDKATNYAAHMMKWVEYGPIPTDPEDGKTYKFGLEQITLGKTLFMNGAMDGYYLATTEDYDAAADVTADLVNGKWTLKVTSDEEISNGKYIAAKISGTHNNIIFSETPFGWTWNAEDKYFSAELNAETEVYIGTFEDHDTLSVSTMDHIDGEDTCLATLYTYNDGAGTTDPEPEPEPEPTPVPAPVTTTIADILDGKTVDENTVYQITGIIEGRDMDDQHGNAYITDPDSGRSIQLYGLSSDMSAFSMDGTSLKYTNLKDAATKLTEVTNGSKVTVNVKWSANYHNAYSVYVSHEASTATYGITVDPVEHGNVSVTPTTASAYGTEATVTVTPDEGYVIERVALTTGMGTSSLDAEEDGTYKFNITVVNKITVTFRDSSAVVTSLEVTSETLGLSNKYVSGTASASGVNFSYNELADFGDGIQWRRNTKDGVTNNSALWNTTAMPSAIESIELHFNTNVSNGYSNSTKARLSVGFATTEIAEDLSIDNVAFDASNPVVTISNTDAAGATYFRINHGTDKGSFYISSIVINLAA